MLEFSLETYILLIHCHVHLILNNSNTRIMLCYVLLMFLFLTCYLIKGGRIWIAEAGWLRSGTAYGARIRWSVSRVRGPGSRVGGPVTRARGSRGRGSWSRTSGSRSRSIPRGSPGSTRCWSLWSYSKESSILFFCFCQIGLKLILYVCFQLIFFLCMDYIEWSILFLLMCWC